MTLSEPDLFELDQPDVYGQFFIFRDLEILSYLRALEKQHSNLLLCRNRSTPGTPARFIAVDTQEKCFFMDYPSAGDEQDLTRHTPELTLTGKLDQVTLQFRSQVLGKSQVNGKTCLRLKLPGQLLRLQRRECFRQETPATATPHCKYMGRGHNGSSLNFNLPVLDISANGLSLLAKATQESDLPQGSVLPDCRLEIPGEGFVAIHLVIRKHTPLDPHGRPNFVRIGCEFINLPGARLAQIQRYITRLEREKKSATHK